MLSQVTVTVNGSPVLAPPGAAVARAIAGQACRTSVTGEPCGALCGMGVCYEYPARALKTWLPLQAARTRSTTQSEEVLDELEGRVTRNHNRL